MTGTSRGRPEGKGRLDLKVSGAGESPRRKPILYLKVTTGAQNDREEATAMARQMICLNGMSDTIGLANCAPRREKAQK